jgi:hypothetical protein
VVVETAAGSFVTKLRGAAQGLPALIAEIIAAELAERLGLPVPERVLIELDEASERSDKNDELGDLLDRSRGENLGFRLLVGGRDFRLGDKVDVEFERRVLWLDGLIQNPDRTSANPNVLIWNRQPWLIDHGAAFPFQYDWTSVTEASPRASYDFSHHLFGSRTSELATIDAELGMRLTRDVLASAAGLVPRGFFETLYPQETAERSAAAYQAFLWKRLKAPRPFINT